MTVLTFPQQQIPALEDYLRQHSLHGIIGRSTSMSEVYGRISKVAPTDVHVIILGESGTGKELVARAIHNEGPRKEKPFVGVNCGALTDSLLESELFGHVKGAYSGATMDKQGYFEVASNGTIFLDEMLSMSPHMQV